MIKDIFILLFLALLIGSPIIIGANWLAKKLEAKPDLATYERSKPPYEEEIITTPLKRDAICEAKAKRGMNCWEIDSITQDEIEDNAREHGDWYKYMQLRYWFKI